MADLTRAYTALRNADAAGDTEAVKKLTEYINSQSPSAASATQPKKENAPSDLTRAYTALRNADSAGDTEAVKKLTEYIKSQSPSADGDHSGMMDPENKSWLQRTFGRDASKAGRLSAGDYFKRAAEGAGTGAAVGGAMGMFTGAGAPAVAGLGAVGGAISGLAEAAAEDLGFGAGTQMLAGLAAPQPGGLIAKGAGRLATEGKEALMSRLHPTVQSGLTRAADTLTERVIPDAANLAKQVGLKKTLGPFYYAAGKAQRSYQANKPIDIWAFERATGVKAQSQIPIGGTQFSEETSAALAQAHGLPADTNPVNALYESAKTAYDSAVFQKGQNFLKSPEFQQLTGGIPANATKFGKIFKNEKGQMVSGQDALQNVKEYVQNNARTDPNGVKRLQDTFNAWMTNTTGKPMELQARQAAEVMFVAKAKDQLPALLQGSSNSVSGAAQTRALLRDNIQNYAKSPQTQNLFFSELGNALRGMNVADAKSIWGSIGSQVRAHMIQDPKKYDELTKIMSDAKTPKDIANFTRVAMKLGYAGVPAAMNSDKQ